ncbi:structural protein [Synechococcus phage S-B68]|nr:structural protein [Synechococcus phage S-B68]
MSESLEQRKQRLLDEMMAAGAGGFTGAAAPEGPTAGYDPVMSQPIDRALSKLKKKKKKKEVKEEVVTEARDGKSAKDKDYSLHDWFKGGGWKQAGGKYDGKPCAKQPGQTTKPFCRDADDRASMSKDERNRRAAKKRREDPNPDRKGKAKMVHEGKTFSDFIEEKDACYHKVKARYDVWPSAYASGALVKCRKKGAKNWGNKSKKKS